MQNKKIILIVVIFAFLGLVSIVLALVSRPDQNPPVQVPTNSGAVVTNDFFKDSLETRDGITYLESNEAYTIMYDNSLNEFTVTLYVTATYQAEQLRNIAEGVFLKKLGITESEACKLTVNLQVPFSSSAELSGVNYGLSFCPGSIPFNVE